MTIQELYEQELAYWTHLNQSFFGVTPIHESDDFANIQAKIDEDCEKYWNSDTPCELAVHFNNGHLNIENNIQVPKSYKLRLNVINMCIDILGDFHLSETAVKTLKIAAIPTPCDDLCWIINQSHYVLRVKATKYGSIFVKKINFELVRGEGWTYDLRTNTFTCTIENEDNKFEPTAEVIFNKHLSDRSKYILENCIKEPLTVDNFTTALANLGSFNENSLFNYTFTRFEDLKDKILNSRRYARPSKGELLGINQLITGVTHVYDNNQKLEGCLIRCDSLMQALENFRTCTNIYDNLKSNKNQNKYSTRSGVNKKISYSGKSKKFSPPFTYTDTTGFFDSFKTVTSKEAGRQRMLLDNIFVKDGMLWVLEKDGELHNMYEYTVNAPSKRLSCLSESPFCNNDKPKRIMMTGKMNAQAVPLKEEVDPLTHRIKARVGFTDIEGYTSADSIIISESFAKRLETHETTIMNIDKSSKIFQALVKFYNKNKYIDIDTLSTIVFPNKNKAIILGWKNVKVDKIEEVTKNYYRVFLSWDIPFRLGDKITNLHGAKGTVGLILPDDKMPRLTKKVGNMEAGPLEVIISGFSTMRRGSLGQIFEAWALASDIPLNGDDYIAIVGEKYKDQMKKYSEDSIVEYNGIKKNIPVGINYIMRLYHHATTKVCLSSAEHGYTRNLRFGEMEKYNLVSNDCPHILKELGIRSIVKYIGSHKLVTELETTRQLPKRTKMSLQFIEILKSIGYDFIIEGDDNYDTEFSQVDLNYYNNVLNESRDTYENND